MHDEGTCVVWEQHHRSRSKAALASLTCLHCLTLCSRKSTWIRKHHHGPNGNVGGEATEWILKCFSITCKQAGVQQYFFTSTWTQPDSATNLLQRKVFVLLLKGGSGLCRSLLPPLSTHSKANSILNRLQLQAGAKSYIQFQRTSLAVIELVSTLHWWMSCDVFIYFWGAQPRVQQEPPPSSWGRSTLGMSRRHANGKPVRFIFLDRLEVKRVPFWKTDYFSSSTCYWNAN